MRRARRVAGRASSGKSNNSSSKASTRILCVRQQGGSGFIARLHIPLYNFGTVPLVSVYR